MAGGSGHKSKKCEEAKGTDCTCDCAGALHRSWILRVAVVGRNLDNDPPDPEPWSAKRFGAELTGIFGPAFDSLTAPLVPGGDQVRASRRSKSNAGWPTVAGVEPAVHQVEKRIVDVALRELLRNVFTLGLEVKPQWIEAVNALTLKKPKGQHLVLADKLGKLPDPNDDGAKMSARDRPARAKDKDSYFWSSMLAALCAVSTTVIPDEHGGNDREVPAEVFTAVFDAHPVEPLRATAVSRLALAIQAAVAADEVFSAVVWPRKSDPTPIAYMTKTTRDPGAEDPSLPSGAIVEAAALLAKAVQTAADAGVSAADCLFVARVIGAASSLDLWDHPAAVRFLLVPAISEVRQRHSAAGTAARFSLDATGENIEHLIYTKLALPWNSRRNWGHAPDRRIQGVIDKLPEPEKKRLQRSTRKTQGKYVTDQKMDAVQALVKTLQQQVQNITERLNRLEGRDSQDDT